VSQHLSTRLQATRPLRTALTAFLLLAYLCASAAVPPGYMPARLDAGAPFHLCPGDARSAWLLAALATSGGAHHHHHHGDEAPEWASVAEPACSFAGSAGAATRFALSVVIPPALSVRLHQSERRLTAWLYPPPRSPPSTRSS
jgi:hypothetical protein